jgi:ribosomal protein S12 methylthiotransferase
MNINDVLTKKIGFISLGCDKNRVDGEKMLAKLKEAGFTITNDMNKVNIVIVNTCAFIEKARKESIDAILSNLPYKNGVLEKIVVTGCLAQKNKVELEKAIPEVDLFLEIKENENIVEKIFALYGIVYLQNKFDNRIRMLTTSIPTAYLKIADGCDNFCAYCTIPYIRGRYKSEKIEDLIFEANLLAKKGVKELILVAQDVTKYGKDIYNEYALPKLLEELSKINGIEWIRLHYLYPELMNDEIIDEIQKNPKICKYVDIPLQHSSNKLLKSMFRRNTSEESILLIDKLRSKIPNISIRSTFIVGLPDENDEDFNCLINFIKKERLDNVGFFPYSREEGTKAYDYPNQIPYKIKLQRLKVAQSVQQNIMLELNSEQVGKILKVLVMNYDEKLDLYFGRDERNSLDVDKLIYFKSNKKLKIGEFVQVKIVDRTIFDKNLLKFINKIDLVGEKI